jgi:hypothetical protein
MAVLLIRWMEPVVNLLAGVRSGARFCVLSSTIKTNYIEAGSVWQTLPAHLVIT